MPAVCHLPGGGPRHGDHEEGAQGCLQVGPVLNNNNSLIYNVTSTFRIYDKEGLGYISTDTLRGLIGELLAPLTDEELEGILEELDEDGSGSMDFDEFCEMMMTKPE